MAAALAAAGEWRHAVIRGGAGDVYGGVLYQTALAQAQPEWGRSPPLPQLSPIPLPANS